jgi:hypothetical protein
MMRIENHAVVEKNIYEDDNPQAIVSTLLSNDEHGVTLCSYGADGRMDGSIYLDERAIRATILLINDFVEERLC